MFARDDARPDTEPATGSPPSGSAPQPEHVAPPTVISVPQRSEQVPRRPFVQELPVFAALDLGTNNCRLLIAVPASAAIAVLVRFAIGRYLESPFYKGHEEESVPPLPADRGGGHRSPRG